MYKIIECVFTNRRLNVYEASSLKKYQFVFDYPEIKVGDMIESPMYGTPLEIINYWNSSTVPEDPRGYGKIKTLIVDTINGKPVNNNSTKEMNKNNMFSGIVGKYKSQFIPQKEENVRMSLSGLLCVPVDGEYVGVDSNNDLISFPEEMTLEIPVYSITKLNANIQPGDIIKSGPKSYSKVISKNDDGSLKTLSFSGYTHNKKAVQDFVMGQATTRVLINMFNFDNESGFNPIFFAMASGETLDVSSLMMLSMTPQGKNLFSNTGGGFNPAMLWMLDQNKSNGSNLMESMMMMSMMGGQNPFASMFGSAKQENPKKDEEFDIDSILADPVKVQKFKEALG